MALARAFINEPRLLLLDEPLGALDLKMRRHMQVELKDLQRRLGMTFLYVTHDQEEAFALSDWIIVMDQGRVEQQDTPEAIYYRPNNVFVADFIGGANLIPGEVMGLRDGRAELATELGRITGDAAPGLAEGQQASACIRMEKVRIGADTAEAAVSGRVTHIIFQGSSKIIEAAAGRQLLRVRIEDERQVAVGDSLPLGLPGEQLRIVHGQLASLEE